MPSKEKKMALKSRIWNMKEVKFLAKALACTVRGGNDDLSEKSFIQKKKKKLTLSVIDNIFDINSN